MSGFSVLKHELVPEHHLVPADEEKQLLDKLGITKEQIPKIRKTDPAIAALEDIYGDIADGRIVRITRKSATAGVSVSYRTVVLD